ncbi:MarR family winged helix-turn-helix transcriptional regulator [Caldicellulosiruptoraceae bacterium PP1]
MDRSYNILNHLLVDIFNDILQIEQNALKNNEIGELSITQIHTIEAIGRGKEKTMSEIAKSLEVTVGTLTIMIDSLIKKGYVERKRKEDDRRVVLVKLTKKGEAVYLLHEMFHREMIRTIIDGLNDEEEKVLINALEKLKEFFRSKYNLTKGKE